MQRIQCELCGSSDMIKQDGVFVCQYCGCKYSLEEARKLMIDGKVDVSGSTIKVDSTEECRGRFQIALEKYYDNRYGDAENELNEIIRRDSKISDVWFLRSLIHRFDSPEKAESYYKQATDIDCHSLGIIDAMKYDAMYGYKLTILIFGSRLLKHSEKFSIWLDGRLVSDSVPMSQYFEFYVTEGKHLLRIEDVRNDERVNYEFEMDEDRTIQVKDGMTLKIYSDRSEL